MYDVVALGELLIDFTTQSVDPDGYPSMTAHPGGAPANFLDAIAKDEHESRQNGTELGPLTPDGLHALLQRAK